ncbi:hypothetical protein OKW21_006740 [Catalinimonas alkaloidigena]|uniref:CPCC family cysteine-rich protein n=1 Tax=Catalinimonas alkaloidigena TaxID=1075417 RepID=UPI0024058891|nr:CPCC family cysteine-rich protein [Catalinimonas alkaloidigena]MDF9801431.1 hypothetical protein [Catalinimonas alkaloidigena]
MREGKLYTCPCCGYIILSEPPGSYEICGICGWEDDAVQLANPCTKGGANSQSLDEGQSNFEYTTPSADIAEYERSGIHKDKKWRRLNNVEKEIYLTESKNGTMWVNKAIYDLSEAYWNKNIVLEKT